MSTEKSRRVLAAEAADRAELQSVVRRIVRTPEDVAAWRIAEYEAETGRVATPEDWAEARADVRADVRRSMPGRD